MFNGRPHGSVELPIPSTPPFDFSRTHLATVADVFPEPPPTDTRTPLQKLMEARFELLHHGTPETTAAADALLVEITDLESRIARFLADCHDGRRARLEQRRAELWEQCRLLEDGKRAAGNEVAQLNAALNARATELTAARQKAADTDIKPFATQFPNSQEMATWQITRSAARAELARAQQRHSELQTELSAAHLVHAEAARMLAAKVEELRAADAELLDCKKT